jgi:hypothetical protein
MSFLTGLHRLLDKNKKREGSTPEQKNLSRSNINSSVGVITICSQQYTKILISFFFRYSQAQHPPPPTPGIFTISVLGLSPRCHPVHHRVRGQKYFVYAIPTANAAYSSDADPSTQCHNPEFCNMYPFSANLKLHDH